MRRPASDPPTCRGEASGVSSSSWPVPSTPWRPRPQAKVRTAIGAWEVRTQQKMSRGGLCASECSRCERAIHLACCSRKKSVDSLMRRKSMHKVRAMCAPRDGCETMRLLLRAAGRVVDERIPLDIELKWRPSLFSPFFLFPFVGVQIVFLERRNAAGVHEAANRTPSAPRGARNDRKEERKIQAVLSPGTASLFCTKPAAALLRGRRRAAAAVC